MLWTQLVCMFVFPLALYGLNGPAQAQAAAIGGGIALLPGALQFALLSLSKNVSALTFLMHLYAGEALKVLIVGSAFWATFHFYNLNNAWVIIGFGLNQCAYVMVQSLRCCSPLNKVNH